MGFKDSEVFLNPKPAPCLVLHIYFHKVGFSPNLNSSFFLFHDLKSSTWTSCPETNAISCNYYVNSTVSSSFHILVLPRILYEALASIYLGHLAYSVIYPSLTTLERFRNQPSTLLRAIPVAEWR